MPDFRNATYEDAFNLFAGKLLGEGIHRKVFECKLRPDLVVKVEDGGDNFWRFFANAHEMRFWNDFQDYAPVAKWLAPCEMLSPDGRILLQKRCEPVTQNYILPEKLPTFLTDHKRENFGWLDGNLVCMDYATTIGNPNIRPKKAHW